MDKRVVLIKLGGSIITNKDIPMSLRQEVLKRLVEEIAQVRKERPDLLFVIGHGQGSFAHVPASKYKTMSGLQNEESVMGMAIVLDSAAQLNRVVVNECLRQDIPAASVLPSQSLITRDRKPDQYFTEIFEEYIKLGIVPVTCGDVIADRNQGCTIWSAEEVLSFFAQKFLEKGWKVDQVVHVVEVDGFYDFDGSVVEKIIAQTWPRIKNAITRTKGFDVTGGIGLKVEESLKLAEMNITSKIVAGLHENNLYHALRGESFIGTTIG